MSDRGDAKATVMRSIVAAHPGWSVIQKTQGKDELWEEPVIAWVITDVDEDGIESRSVAPITANFEINHLGFVDYVTKRPDGKFIIQSEVEPKSAGDALQYLKEHEGIMPAFVAKGMALFGEATAAVLDRLEEERMDTIMRPKSDAPKIQ